MIGVIAMSKHTELPSDKDGTDAEFNLDADPATAATPVRFGRLALWVASASALTIGVMGTVAYGVWFNQDQHTYAEAMEHARQTLWVSAPTPAPTPAVDTVPALQQMSLSGYAASTLSPLSPLSPAPQATVASAAPKATAPSTQFGPRAAPANSTAPKLVVIRPVRGSCSASAEHHRPVSRVKSNGNLFTRMGSFFHRVSYRQHGTESQRDIYAHP
jgi:hypothetical protein